MRESHLLIFSFLFLIGFANGLIAQPDSDFEPRAYIVVYKETGFRGESEKFFVGEYPKLEDRWRDQMKSVSLIGGVRVTLFDNDRFEGKKELLEHSAYELGELKGDVESMIVEPFSCESVIVYKDTIYRGKSRTFPLGEYRKLDDGWSNDIESIDLCGDVVVTLFDDEDFEGDSIEIDRDHIDLGKFKKEAESMIVAKFK